MKTVLQVLAVVVCAVAAGCGGPAVSTADIEKATLADCNAQMTRKGAGACTSVELVQQTSSVYVGTLHFTDGTQQEATVTVDASTGRAHLQTGKIERSTP